MTGCKVVCEVKIAEKTAVEVLAWSVEIGALVEGTGRGVSVEIGGGESTHIGVGDSILQEGG